MKDGGHGAETALEDHDCVSPTDTPAQTLVEEITRSTFARGEAKHQRPQLRLSHLGPMRSAEEVVALNVFEPAAAEAHDESPNEK